MSGGATGAAPRVLAVIPARGGSKGVVRKNLRPLGGRPLIAHTIEAALAVRRRLDALVVSTDDPEIAEVARGHGVEVPFLRPRELAGDTVPTVPVLQHAVEEMETRRRVRFDAVLLLQPTAPFRSAADIEAVIDLLAERPDFDSVISVVRVFAAHPILMKRIGDGGELLPFAVEEREGTRRQDYDPPAFMRNGALYLTRRGPLMERGSIWGRRICPYVMPEERSHNIDSEIDLLVAEALWNRAQGGPAPRSENPRKDSRGAENPRKDSRRAENPRKDSR
ncbi:MAG: acylneuraminate cytidylyltransferase family protein [Acidobacteriota bacterium]